MTITQERTAPAQHWRQRNDRLGLPWLLPWRGYPRLLVLHGADRMEGPVNLRAFLWDNFGWDIYDWADDDIRF